MPKEGQQPPAHRDMDMVVRDLKAHLEWKMGLLPDLAKNFHLGDEAIAGLKAHLQEEFDYLSTLPEDITLKQVMGNHFKRGAELRKMVTGKGDDEEG